MTNPYKDIVVEYTKPKGHYFPIVSLLIRFLQWKFWKGQSFVEVPSHVRLKFFDYKHQVYWVYEASGRMVKLIGSEYVEKTTTVVKRYTFPVTDSDKDELIKLVNKKSGIPYGSVQLLGYGIKLIGKMFYKNITNPFADGDKSDVCVELIFTTFKNLSKFKEAFKIFTDKYNLKQDSIDLNESMLLMQEMEKLRWR